MAIIDQTFNALERHVQDPEFQDIHPLAWNRRYKHHSIHVAAAHAAIVAEPIVGFKQANPLICYCLDQILCGFIQMEKKTLFETIGRDGTLVNDPQGRMINPGHAFESMALCLYAIHTAQGRGNNRRVNQVIDWMCQRSFDLVHGGILTLLDATGEAPAQTAWHQQAGVQPDDKFWSTHVAALHALGLLAVASHNESYLEPLDELSRWCLNHFNDAEHGEWHAAFDCQGQPKVADKGTKWKAAYHWPRALMQIIKALRVMSQRLPPTDMH